MAKIAALLAVLLFIAGAAAAQSVDIAAGLGAVAGGGLRHGWWPGFSATGMFTPRFGINADLAVRAARVDVDFRPYLASFNFVLRDPLPNWSPELQLGYALEIQEPQGGCIFGVGPDFGVDVCGPEDSKYTSGFHLGVADTFYFARRGFVRFEFHQYAGGDLDHPARFAVSVGYTFGRRS